MPQCNTSNEIAKRVLSFYEMFNIMFTRNIISEPKVVYFVSSAFFYPGYKLHRQVLELSKM